MNKQSVQLDSALRGIYYPWGYLLICTLLLTSGCLFNRKQIIVIFNRCNRAILIRPVADRPKELDPGDSSAFLYPQKGIRRGDDTIASNAPGYFMVQCADHLLIYSLPFFGVYPPPYPMKDGDLFLYIGFGEDRLIYACTPSPPHIPIEPQPQGFPLEPTAVNFVNTKETLNDNG